MILVEELLQPITEGNPSGAWLRYDPLYDAIKEARREWRVAPLDWIGLTLPAQVHPTPLNQAGHSWPQYRTRHIVDAPLPPEAFEQSFAGTPLPFYVDLEQQLDAALSGRTELP